MPKPFLLGVEIEEASFGRVMRKINGLPGVIALHVDFQKPGKTGKPDKSKPNGAGRNTFETTAVEAVTKALAGGKTMTPKQMRELFEKQGRSPKSASSILHNMKQSGALVSRGGGAWGLGKRATAKKAAAKKKD